MVPTDTQREEGGSASRTSPIGLSHGSPSRLRLRSRSRVTARGLDVSLFACRLRSTDPCGPVPKLRVEDAARRAQLDRGGHHGGGWRCSCGVPLPDLLPQRGEAQRGRPHTLITAIHKRESAFDIVVQPAEVVEVILLVRGIRDGDVRGEELLTRVLPRAIAPLLLQRLGELPLRRSVIEHLEVDQCSSGGQSINAFTNQSVNQSPVWTNAHREALAGTRPSPEEMPSSSPATPRTASCAMRIEVAASIQERGREA